MTVRQLLLRDGVGGQAPALFGSWVSFDAQGIPAGYRLPPGVAATSRVARMAFAVALSTSESPAHRWRDPVQWALRTHCNGQRRSFSAGCLEWPRAVSGGLVPAPTLFHRPGDWVLHARVLRTTSAKQVHAGLKPNVEVWRLIATHEWIDVRLVLDACQGHDGPRVTMARDIRDLRHVRIVGCGSNSCRSPLLLSWVASGCLVVDRSALTMPSSSWRT
jgi:hypothetical protein